MKLPLVILATLALAGCGLLGKGKSNGGAADEPESTGSSVHFDATELTTMLGERSALWTYRFTVASELRAQGDEVDLSRLVHDVADQSFPAASALTFEITATDAATKELLASNLPPDAAKYPVEAKKWADNCADVTPSFAYGTGIRLCDFAGIHVNPTLRLEPVQGVEDPRWITWECAQENDNRLHDNDIVLYSPNYAVCEPRYTLAPAASVATAVPLQNADGTYRPMALPQDVASHSFQMKTVNTFLKFIPGAPVSKRYSLEDVELDHKGPLALPVGKMEDCHALEVQLLYKDSDAAASGSHKEARLTFHRSLGAHDLTWLPDDQTTLPSPAQIYAADQEQVRYWLHCRWYNTSGVELSAIPY